MPLNFVTFERGSKNLEFERLMASFERFMQQTMMAWLLGVVTWKSLQQNLIKFEVVALNAFREVVFTSMTKRVFFHSPKLLVKITEVGLSKYYHETS